MDEVFGTKENPTIGNNLVIEQFIFEIDQNIPYQNVNYEENETRKDNTRVLNRRIPPPYNKQ